MMEKIKRGSGGWATAFRSHALRATVAVVVLGATVTVSSSAFASSKGAKDATPRLSTQGLVIGQILLSGGLYQDFQEADVIKAAKADGMTVKSCNANDTPTGQQNCVDEMISSKVAGVIMQPSSDSSATSQIKQMQGAGIPVVTWAVGPTTGVSAPFLGLDERPQSVAAGVTAAKWVEAHFHTKPSVALVSIPGNTNCTNRMGGLLAGVREVDPTAKLVANENGEGSTLPSENVMANIIQSGKKFNIVGACNGDSSIGVLDALRAAGRGKAVNKIPLTEYVYSADGIPSQMSLLLSKTSSLMEVIGLDPVTNASGDVAALVKYMNKKIPSTYVGNLFDTVLLPNCAQGLKFLKDDYDATVSCTLK
jgi:ABC-type sugar transport system substrate-binding protein